MLLVEFTPKLTYYALILLSFPLVSRSELSLHSGFWCCPFGELPCIYIHVEQVTYGMILSNLKSTIPEILLHHPLLVSCLGLVLSCSSTWFRIEFSMIPVMYTLKDTIHFNTAGHTFDDLTVMVIEHTCMANSTHRKQRESYWIHTL